MGNPVSLDFFAEAAREAEPKAWWIWKPINSSCGAGTQKPYALKPATNAPENGWQRNRIVSFWGNFILFSGAMSC